MKCRTGSCSNGDLAGRYMFSRSCWDGRLSWLPDQICLRVIERSDSAETSMAKPISKVGHQFTTLQITNLSNQYKASFSTAHFGWVVADVRSTGNATIGSNVTASKFYPRNYVQLPAPWHPAFSLSILRFQSRNIHAAPNLHFSATKMELNSKPYNPCGIHPQYAPGRRRL